MSVLLCQPSLTRTGSASVLLDVARALHDHHELVVLAGENGDLREAFDAVAKASVIVDAPMLRRSLRAVPRYLSSFPAVKRTVEQICRTHTVEAAYINTIMFPQAALAAAAAGIPTIAHVHEVAARYPGWYYRRSLSLSTRSARHIVAPSHFVVNQPEFSAAHRGRPTGGRTSPPGKAGRPTGGHASPPGQAGRSAGHGANATTTVVYNSRGPDPGPTAHPDREQLALLSVTAIDRRKGVRELVAAVTALLARGVRCRLDIVGSTPDRRLYNELTRAVRAQRLEGSIVFHGAQTDVDRFYRNSDLVVQASHAESLSLALIDAARFSLPAVTTDCGGTTEVVRDGETGLVAPVADIDALAHRIAELAADPERRQRMGEAAYRRYQSFFTPLQFKNAILPIVDATIRQVPGYAGPPAG